MASEEVVYSYSRLTTFEQCARRFRYRYLDRVREAFVGVEAFMGQRVHETIEWLFNQRESGHQHSDSEAVGYYCSAWDQAIAAAPRTVRVIKSGEVIENYRRSGAQMLSRFHADRFVTDTLETIENEKHFRIKLGDSYWFQGFIDRLARDTAGVLHVIDYKTGRQASAKFAGKDGGQLEAYALAMFAQTDAQEIELVLEYLKTGARLTRRVARVDAEAVEKRLTERIDVASSATVFPPVTGVLCSWCGYNDLCEAWSGKVGRSAA